MAKAPKKSSRSHSKPKGGAAKKKAPARPPKSGAAAGKKPAPVGNAPRDVVENVEAGMIAPGGNEALAGGDAFALADEAEGPPVEAALPAWACPDDGSEDLENRVLRFLQARRGWCRLDEIRNGVDPTIPPGRYVAILQLELTGGGCSTFLTSGGVEFYRALIDGEKG